MTQPELPDELKDLSSNVAITLLGELETKSIISKDM